MQYLFYNTPTLIGLLMICSVMGLVLTGFTTYHLVLTLANVTTNETFKWSALEQKVEYLHNQNQVRAVTD